MPLLRKKSVLAAKIETTIGTNITPIAADAVFNVYNATMSETLPMTARELQGAFSNLPSVPGAQMGTCTFTHDLTIGTTAPQWMTTFLPACGLVKQGGLQYKPTSEAPGSNTKTLTIRLYQDGLMKTLLGAMGTVRFNFVAGQMLSADFTFTGAYLQESASAIIAPTYPTIPFPTRFANCTVTLDTTLARINTFSLDLGNNVIMREAPQNYSGYISAIITDRTMTGSYDIEADTSGSPSRVTKWQTGATSSAIVTTTGEYDGSVLTLTMPKLQITNMQRGDRNGMLVDNVDYLLVATTADGEFTLDYTLGT